MAETIDVHTLNHYIKAQLDSDANLRNVYVKGEISNYRPHPTGHMYFTLKDEFAAVNAVMFSSNAHSLKFKAENGMKVIVRAHVSVYEKTGQYQLYVTAMTLDGIGSLYAQFEALKKKLSAEGLFDEAHKKAIPRYPHNILILSARQGAALQDTLRTIHKRYPIAHVGVLPIPVQGKGAYEQIIKALQFADARIVSDVILLVRGGGSIEDLWNFNEEALCRCIYNMRTPVITGVGHETDFTLVDFVSDHRSPTPTGAAVDATPDIHEMENDVLVRLNRINQIMHQRMVYERERLNRYSQHYIFKNPSLMYENELMRLDQAKNRLHHFGTEFVSDHRHNIQTKVTRLNYIMKTTMTKYRNDYAKNVEKLDLVSPLKLLSKGYSIVMKDDEVVESVTSLKKDDAVTIQFKDGKKDAIIQ
jgi:exodeoxyribonuclease VII large subunit